MKPLRVLAIGNSFSICAGKCLPEIALTARKNLKFASAYIGGCSLEHHCECLEQNSNEYTYTVWTTTNSTVVKNDLGNASLAQMLKDDGYDIVTIQQASHFSWKPETYEPYAEQLISRIREDQPQAEIVVQQTWSYRNQDARLNDGEWGITQTEMYERLDAAYRHLAQKYGFRRIPMGTAVQIAREKSPVKFQRISQEELEKYRSPDLPPQYGDVVGNMRWYKHEDGSMRIGQDNIHLNRYGEYLQGCVWFGALFGIDPETAEYNHPVIGNGDCAFLRKCAKEALLCEGYKF